MNEIIKPLFYGKMAYNSNDIPEQPALGERGWLLKFSGVRLPWGRTQDVSPNEIMQDLKPESMRFWESVEREKSIKKTNGTYVPAPLEGAEFYQKYDQEIFRFAQLPFRSQFWIFLLSFGKVGFILISTVYAVISLLVSVATRNSDIKMSFSEAFMSGFWPFIFPALLSWIVGYIVINYLPGIWLRPPKGPLWELNRRTGLVTFFDYKRFKKKGFIDEVTAPFYEFDAYIVTSPDRQGSPMNGLFLIHRYRDIRINFNNLITPDNTLQKPCALWDFFQNFMDISRPLPDIPLYEPYRHLDPVTAEYDRQQQRPPRYWIDMDDETFKAQVKEMLGKIDAIDTFSRPNLMARHVTYRD